MSPGKKTVEAIYPLSPQQQGMLFETLAAPQSGIHVEQLTCDLLGELDRPAFERAWKALLARHAILRTAFAWQDQPQPLQIVLRDVEMPIADIAGEDWRDLQAEEEAARLQAFLAADRRLGFRLSKPPLMRLALLDTGRGGRILVWSHHHILMDGWCRPVLLREFFALYEDFYLGRPPALPPSRPYRDYITWLGRQDAVHAEAFWRQALRGFRRPTALGRLEAAGMDGLPPAPPGHATLEGSLPRPEMEALQVFAQRLRVTLSTVVQAAWALLLSRYSGESDVVFGVTVSGRPAELDGIESTIGLFINTLPLRVSIDPTEPLDRWLAKLQAQSLELRRYEHVSSGQVHRWSEVPGAMPLHESILVFENYPDIADIAADLRAGSPDDPARRSRLAIRAGSGSGIGGQTRQPLTVLVTPGAELGVTLVHDPRRLRDARPVLDHFLSLLRGMASDPERPLKSLTESLPEPEIPRFVPLVRAASAAHGQLSPRNVPPRTSLEEMLALLWSQVLGLQPVGIEDDFFSLGGHSLIAAELVGLAREAFQVDLPLRSLFEHPTIAGLAAEIARLKGEGGDYEGALVALPVLVPDPARRQEPFPLSDVQEAYWIGRSQAFELGNVSNHLYLEFEIEGLDPGRFEHVWRRLIDRHDMLRAVVLPDGRQQILPRVPAYVVEVLDVRGDDPAEAEAKLLALRERLSHQVLPADRWPLFEVRASLLPGFTRLHFSFDLLIGDAWSWLLLSSEVRALLRDPDASLAPLELSFRDYMVTVAALEGTVAHDRSLEYWRDRLKTLPAGPDLPLTKSPAAIAQPRFARRRGVVEPAAWAGLKERATRRGLTPSGLLLAVFAEALAAWSKSPRFTLTLTLFNRLPLHPQVNQIVGDFTSLVLLEVDAAGGGTFEERARRIQRRLWDDLDHRYVSGVRVLREMGAVRGRSAQLSMPVVFTSTLTLPDLALEPQRPEGGEAGIGTPREGYTSGQTSQVWLDHQVAEQDGRLVLIWDAVEELFPAGLLDDMLAAYLALLARLAAGEEAWREAAPLRLPAASVAHLALDAAAHPPAAVAEGLLHAPFLAQVRERPESPAVLTAEKTLCYRDLWQSAGGLGRRLRAAGVEPGSLVGVVMTKGWEQAAAVLGVLAAGAAYLPVDAELPQERRDYLLIHGGVRVVLTQPCHAASLSWPAGVSVLGVDDTVGTAGEDGAWPEPVASPDDLAYTIFTSGSTGLPKGVMIEHRSALNTVVDVNRRFSVGPADRVLGVSSLSFDLSVYDLFGLWAAGGAVVLPEASAGRDPARWLELLKRFSVTVWNTVPALLEMLVEYAEGRGARLPAALRLVLLSGDWLPLGLPARLRALASGALEVVSLGGATEASIWSILYPVGDVDPAWRSIPYGRAMAGQSFEVLDPNLAPRPVWVPGELYIGGAGLARGYWRDPEKTATSFVASPETGERLYRTGDLGRWLPDGTIEFLGREDFQVKIQGHRIELGEIEAALVAHPGVETALVTAIGDPRTGRRLAAYVVLSEEGRSELQRGASHREHKLGQAALRAVPEGALELVAPELDEIAVEQLYLSRRSFRDLAAEPVAAADLGRLLAGLRQLRLAEHPLPKLRYGSAGSLYPVQVYLYVAMGRIEGVSGGTYYYHPVAHRLVPLAPEARIDVSVHAPINRATFAGSAFSLFLIGQMDAIVPTYGERGRHYAVLEAGAMTHLLETSAAACGLGLCQIGDLDFAAIRHLFDLGEQHALLHSLVGGRIDPSRTTLAGFLAESKDYQMLLGLGAERGAEPAVGPALAPTLANILRDFLRGKLPAYQVPASFTVLERLPLTANGKIDRAALPDPQAARTAEAPAIPTAPRDGLEREIAALWREVLHTETVGVDDNFFAMGGHSVTMVRVYNRLREALDREFPLLAMFEYPTIAALARYLRAGPEPTAAVEAVEQSTDRGDRRREALLARRAGAQRPRGGDLE
jgi:amino acid adenylation domain-containing protein